MEKIPGSMISPYVEASSAKVDEAVWLNLAELLAKLHTIPLQSFTDLITKYEGIDIITMEIREYYKRQVDEWSTYLTTKPHLESPTIVWALRWLKANIPDDERTLVLVHGDFNLHNILGQDGKVTGVVDWETSMFGSAEQDLA